MTPACAIDEVAVEIPAGKTFTLSGCNIFANSVNSAGTLIFTGAASLTAQAITGSLACDVTGTVQTSHVYLTAPTGSAVTFPATTGVKGNGGVWQNSGAFDIENFKGLVLYTTVDGITVELYKDFSTDAANLVTPAYTDGRYRYYAVSANDIYYGVSKPANSNDKTRYELHQTFYISESEANQKVEFDMTPGVRSTAGWETVEAVCRFTDEVMQKAFPSNANNWSQYQEIFTTPAFQPGRTEHGQTTQQEMEDFLKELDGPDDNIHIFSLGKTAMGSFDIPLVLVTSVELPEDVTLEQAAALIRADSEQNGKLTVHYQAQIHGDEPEVVFDNHEYRFNLETKAVTKRDMMICSHFLPIFSEEYKETAIGLAYAAFDQLEEDNLTYSWYSSDAQNYSISSVSSAVGSGNTAYRGSMHILMETLGNNYGKNLYERRVASHVSAVTGILNHLDTNTAEVKAVIKAQQNTIVENGKTYNQDDVLAMTHQSNYHPEYNIQGKKVNLRNGGEVDFTFEARMADTILTTRVAPTAYVIPAGESFTRRVLNLMDMQGIAYKSIPAGSSVMLQQYLGTVDAAGTVSATTLTEDMLVAFPNGAYVFCMNQVDDLILSCYMEPDYATTTETLARQGIIAPTDGAYPIYRYIHDLNAKGFIDYMSFETPIVLEENMDELVLTGDYYLDLNGYSVSNVVTDGNTLYCMDSATDDFTGSYGKLEKVDNAANVTALSGYLPVNESGAVSFHKYEMELQYVNISPSRKGISYTTTFRGDEAIKAQVKEFGIAMRLYAAPNETTIWADPDGLSNVALAQSEWQTGNHDEAVKSVYIKNILDWNATDAQNLQRAAIPIYGRSYIQLQNGKMLFSEAVGFSMESTMEQADLLWEELGTDDRTALVNMYLNPENHSFMQTWELPNIKTAAGESGTDIPA